MKDEYINFLKRSELYNQEAIDFIKPKTIYVDYRNESERDFVGCYPIVKNGILKDIRYCVPKIVDDISISMNIHEYVHLITTYKYLNKKYIPDTYEELLPVYYELIYLKENDSDYFDYYLDYLKTEEKDYFKILFNIFEDNKKGLVKSK